LGHQLVRHRRAGCRFGTGFVQRADPPRGLHGKFRAIGAASAFNDLKGTLALRNARDQQAGFVPTLGENEITATLAFAYQLPSTSYEIHAVQSPQEVPGWTPPQP